MEKKKNEKVKGEMKEGKKGWKSNGIWERKRSEGRVREEGGMK